MSTADFPPRAASPALRKRQARLARAVLLADRGDAAGAMALVTEVLGEDPHYAPASALLDRLNKGARPGVSAACEPPPAPPRVAQGSWAQFERRMRLRRESTCATAMRQAMDAGDYPTALARARELAKMDPAWNDVRLLLEHDPAPLPTQEASVPAPRRRRPRLLVVALALFVLTSTGGWVVGHFYAPRTGPAASERLAPVPSPAAAVEVPGLPPIGTASPAAEGASSVQTPGAATAASAQPSDQPTASTWSEKEKPIAKNGSREAPASGDSPASRAATTDPASTPVSAPLPQQYMQMRGGDRPAQPYPLSSPYPPAPGPAASPAATAGTLGSSTLAVGSNGTTGRAPEVRPEPGTVALETLPLVPSQPEPAPPSPPAAATRSDSASATGNSPSAAPGNTDERRGVAATLAAYQQGYRALDAAAVQRVWPGVDAQQLRSAFAQLESQRLAFSGCSIDIRGLHASATCSGTATYVPKVGSGEPVKVQRTWQFALQKFGEGWLIDAATAR